MNLLLVLLVAVGANGLAPLIRSDEHIKDRYIVKVRTSLLVEGFKAALQLQSDQVLQETGGKSGQYEFLFAMEANPSVLVMLLDQVLLEKVRANAMVGYVEEDGLNEIKDVLIGEQRLTPPENWGLDRINQVSPELDGDTSFSGDGFGVNIYVIDSGVDITHEDFEGRAGLDFDVFEKDGFDCTGHGTNVAGIAASKTWGVAKQATIHSVRTLDCRNKGGTSHIVRAIDWVTENGQAPCVATMSFSKKTTSPTICDAVQKLAESGCVPVAAASNVNDGDTDYDACTYSPAKSSYAITVGASVWPEDKRAPFSRYGRCVDIHAPGYSVRTTALDGQYVYASGTAIAVPFVAGVAAIHLGNGVPAEEVHTRIVGEALACQMSDVGIGTPNRLLHIDSASPIEK